MKEKQSLRNLVEAGYGFRFQDALIDAICESGELRKVKAGDVLIEIGETMRFMPLLIEGAIKILREDAQGDDLLLYFLERGDTCAMTMSCCMGSTKSEIRAEAEMDSVLVMIPVEKMSDWISEFEDWKAFVFDSYNSRLSEMLEAIDGLAFSNMHDRIFKYLRDKVMVTGELQLSVTHQGIANDLHTSRVVVSRILKSLEKEGKLKMHRNKIELSEI